MPKWGTTSLVNVEESLALSLPPQLLARTDDASQAISVFLSQRLLSGTQIDRIFYMKSESGAPSTEVEDHVKEVFTPIAEQLKDQKLSFPQTILYTDTNIIGLVYDIFDEVLGAEQYIKAPFIPENRIFAQHHRTYTPNMKVGIVAELTKEDSILRFVIATPDSMGLGLNAAHIRLVIHYKPSNSLPQYFQETGR